jgi:hypothetical protein
MDDYHNNQPDIAFLLPLETTTCLESKVHDRQEIIQNHAPIVDDYNDNFG